jgi:hypothetical protein
VALFVAPRIETTTNQNHFAYMLVSIWASRFDFAIAPLSARLALLDHQK